MMNLTVNIDPSSLEAYRELGLGFALAGLLASGFEWTTARRASFSLLGAGGVLALASVPVVAVSAPFILLRNTIRGRRAHRLPLGLVLFATAAACAWGLLCGRVVLDAAHRLIG